MQEDIKKNDKDAELKRIKKNIENAYENFRDNYRMFNSTRKFVFVTSMEVADESLNKTLDRPSIEFPVLESYVSRLRGELAKHTPTITVGAKDGAKVDGELVQVLEDHMRHIMYEANKNGLEYNLYTDTLTGGFSGAKVYTDYTSEMSFHQDIYVRRVFDPTMTFWDPMAREDDKSDGRFCGELFPMYKDEFVREFPNVDMSAFKFGKGMMMGERLGGFKWSYKGQNEDVILIGHYYEKKSKKKRIVLLTNQQVMTTEDYKEFLSEWELSGRIEQAPQIVGKPRWTELTSIKRYTICETKIIEEEETDYASLPIPFFDGNSILQKDSDNAAVRQFTRPIVYQAKGAQRLKNFAGQTLTNELETLVQHKWMVPIEGIPPLYKDAYTNVQQAQVLVYNAFKDNNPDIPLPPPQAVVRPPIPPEIIQTFMGCDTIIQNILGAFDPSLARLGEREVSGIAIQESLSLSNAAAMPYVVSFLKGLQAVANRILELIPKVYLTPRSIPILTKDGKRDYALINQEGGIRMDYDRNALQVKVEAGPSFGSQQSKALQQMTQLMQISPVFQQFMTAHGLPVLLDNMEFRGIEVLKEKTDDFMQQLQEMQKKEMGAPNPDQMKMQIEQMRMQQKAKQDEIENRIAAAELEMERQKMQVNVAQIMADLEEARMKAALDKEKYHSENQRKAAEMIMQAHSDTGKMSLEQKKLEHALSESREPSV